MSKSNELLVKISKRNKGGVESWEGTATLPGLTPAKVAKSKSSESKFSTRSALTSAAQRLASRYGFSEVKFEGAGSEKPKAEKTEKSPRRNKKATETTTPETCLA